MSSCDEDLLRRVAELESYTVRRVRDDPRRGMDLICETTDADGDPVTLFFNPLTYLGQAFELIEAHRIECKWALDRNQWRATTYDEFGSIAGHGKDASLARAVLLAIVDAGDESP